MDINSQNPGGDTALHFAAEKGRAETVKLLLERGVGTETTNVDDYTPLHLTAWTAQQGAARALLDAGANLEAPDVEGWTPPPYKVDTSRPSLRTNWTRLVPFPHRWTPLHVATANGHHAMVDFLCDAGADKDARNANGDTPLHMAAEKGHEMVSRLALPCPAARPPPVAPPAPPRAALRALRALRARRRGRRRSR